jgi:hypothetical protein
LRRGVRRGEYFFFSAERAEKKKKYAMVIRKRYSRGIKSKCAYKIVMYL